MKIERLFAVLVPVLFLATGCTTAYVRYNPGLVISHKKVISKPVYSDERRFDDYEEVYDDEVVAESRTEVWIGTTIIIGGAPLYWCDFCMIWHPRCVPGYCGCVAPVRRHYGFYIHGIYYDHCYQWTYDPHFVPVISRYRFKTNDRYVSYDVARKKREFLKAGSARPERIRYRGKEVNRYTFTANPDGTTAHRGISKKPARSDNANKVVQADIRRNGNMTSPAERSRVQTHSDKRKNTSRKRMEPAKRTVTTRKSESLLLRVRKIFSPKNSRTSKQKAGKTITGRTRMKSPGPGKSSKSTGLPSASPKNRKAKKRRHE